MAELRILERLLTKSNRPAISLCLSFFWLHRCNWIVLLTRIPHLHAACNTMKSLTDTFYSNTLERLVALMFSFLLRKHEIRLATGLFGSLLCKMFLAISAARHEFRSSLSDSRSSNSIHAVDDLTVPFDWINWQLRRFQIPETIRRFEIFLLSPLFVQCATRREMLVFSIEASEIKWRCWQQVKQLFPSFNALPYLHSSFKISRGKVSLLKAGCCKRAAFEGFRLLELQWQITSCNSGTL